jgi:hypothetical protein
MTRHGKQDIFAASVPNRLCIAQVYRNMKLHLILEETVSFV